MADAHGMGRGAAAAIVTALLLNLHPSPAQGQGGVARFREVHLGLEVAISVDAPADRAAMAAASAFARIAELDLVLSDWRRDSELNRVADSAVGRWWPVSADLFEVLSLAREVAEATGGAFDPTIGALTLLWRRQRERGVAPDAATLAAARATVGWRGIELDRTTRRVRLARPGTHLDLGGIAKGWILDQARETMARRGVTSVLLEAGGDVVAGDPPLGSSGWLVAIATPRGDSVITVARAALATSGPSAQRLIDPDGTPRSHVIDPATGAGLAGSRELTVRAATGAIADAIATALTVLPRSRWSAVAAKFGVEILMVTGDGSRGTGDGGRGTGDV